MKNHKAIHQDSNGINRRGFIEKTIFASAGLAALAASQNQTSAQTEKRNNTTSVSNASIGRRKLGKLEVSAVGLGVQNMHRRYETTVPYRPEMISIIRAAYDRGITFFDCADARCRSTPGCKSRQHQRRAEDVCAVVARRWIHVDHSEVYRHTNDE